MTRSKFTRDDDDTLPVPLDSQSFADDLESLGGLVDYQALAAKLEAGHGLRPAALAAIEPLAGGRHAPKLVNPMVSAAGRLLMLLQPIRHAEAPFDADGWRLRLADGLERFQATARRDGLHEEAIDHARYVLCFALDEAIACAIERLSSQASLRSSPVAKGQSLLERFFPDVDAQEHVLPLITQLAQDVPAHRDLLELIGLVLALGFEGRFRQMSQGAARLACVRDRLASLLAKERPPVPRSLSRSILPAHAFRARRRVWQWIDGLLGERARRKPCVLLMGACGGDESFLLGHLDPGWRRRHLVASAAFATAEDGAASAAALAITDPRALVDAQARQEAVAHEPPAASPATHVFAKAPTHPAICRWCFAGEHPPSAPEPLPRESKKVRRALHANARAWVGVGAAQHERRLVDAAIIVIDIADLIRCQPAALADLADRLHGRMQELTQQLDGRFPVYMLVSGIERLAGFDAYFAGQGPAERSQVWGFGLGAVAPANDGQDPSKCQNVKQGKEGKEGPKSPASDSIQARALSEFGHLQERLQAGLAGRMRDQPDPRLRAEMLGFPVCFDALQSGLASLLGAWPQHLAAMLRGIYFSSGLPGRAPLDPVMGGLLPPARRAARQLAAAAADAQNREGDFLGRLIQDVVLPDNALPGASVCTASQGLVHGDATSASVVPQRRRARFSLGLRPMALFFSGRSE